MTNGTKVSVVIASFYSPAALKDCLESVLANPQNEIEIIAADCCLRGKRAEMSKQFPAVNFLEFPANAKLPILLAAGIKRASGEIIAITDSSCVVGKDWISAIRRAHRTESPIIGGAVEMFETGASLTDWAAYFCDYAQFMTPAAPGIVEAVPGNNLAVKSEILKRGAEPVENEFWKTLWCRKLQGEGVKLFFEPSISVRCRKTYQLMPFLSRRFHQGRCFAAMRLANEPGGKRALYAFGSVLLPALFLFRAISPVIRRKRFLAKLIFSLPVICLAAVFWACGEAVGYAAGAGNSSARID